MVFRLAAGAEDGGALTGERGREGKGVGCVDERWWFFFLLRAMEASVPDASEILGLPGRLSDRDDVDFFIPPSRSLARLGRFSLRPEGVFEPVDKPERCLASSSALAFFSASTR